MSPVVTLKHAGGERRVRQDPVVPDDSRTSVPWTAHTAQRSTPGEIHDLTHQTTLPSAVSTPFANGAP